MLQQPADRQIQRGSRPVQHGRDKDNAAFTAARRSQSDDVGALAALLAAAKGGQPTRDDVLASLAELLGAPQRGFENQAPSLLAAVRGQQGLPAAMQQQQEPHQDQQQGLPSEECAPAACSHGGPTDFSRRNMARLGGEGVAGIFAGSSAGKHFALLLDCASSAKLCWACLFSAPACLLAYTHEASFRLSTLQSLYCVAVEQLTLATCLHCTR